MHPERRTAPPNSRPYEPTDRNRPRHKTSTPEPPHRQHDPHTSRSVLKVRNKGGAPLTRYTCTHLTHGHGHAPPLRARRASRPTRRLRQTRKAVSTKRRGKQSHIGRDGYHIVNKQTRGETRLALVHNWSAPLRSWASLPSFLSAWTPNPSTLSSQVVALPTEGAQPMASWQHLTI